MVMNACGSTCQCGKLIAKDTRLLIDFLKVLLFSYFFGWLGHSKGLFIPICTKFIGHKTSDDIMTNRRLRFLSIHILFLLCAVLFKRNGRCLMPLLTKHMSIHLFVRELIIQ